MYIGIPMVEISFMGVRPMVLEAERIIMQLREPLPRWSTQNVLMYFIGFNSQ